MCPVRRLIADVLRNGQAGHQAVHDGGHRRVLGIDAPRPPQAVEVEARQPYKLWIRFEDGVSGIGDLARWSTRNASAAWSDASVFKTAHLRPYGAVAWGTDDACSNSMPSTTSTATSCSTCEALRRCRQQVA